MGTVFKKGGKYLRYSEHTTHTGTHRSAKWVDELQLATVFHTQPPLRLRQDEQLQYAERLEATETRTVTLTPNAPAQAPAKAATKERVMVFPKGSIVKFDGIPCELLQDTPYESAHFRAKTAG